MLDELDTVDWGSLEHAYGSAADVPGLLRSLLASDPREREGAMWHLWGNIFHQGRRFQASACAVPFLLEVLAEPATPDRRAIVELLTGLAIGYDESWLPDGFPAGTYRAEAAGGEELLRALPRLQGDSGDWARTSAYWDSLDSGQCRQLEASIDLAVYDAARAGAPLLRTLLEDDAPGMRTAAAYALAWFPEEAEGSLPALIQTAADREAAVAATALVALGLVGSIELAQVVEPALDDPRDAVRWAAAVALARLRRREAGPRVGEELVGWSGGSSRRHPDIPFLDGDLGGYAVLALRFLDASLADASFDALLTRLPAVTGLEAVPVLAEALRHAFPDGALLAGTRFEALTETQRRLVRALADSPATWAGLLNTIEFVRAYGLPHQPDRIRAYAAGVDV